jgi:hypothetical protein
MKRFLLFFALIAAALSPAAEKLPLDAFLRQVRHPSPTATFAALEGTIQHRRSGEPAKSEPLYFAVILQPERMTGQIVVGGTEGYLIGQTRQAGNSETSVIPMRGATEEHNLLGYMGVRPSDLTMSFLYYPATEELKPDSVRGIGCRVVMLEAPDKSERAKVYIAENYFFPLRAEFFKPGETVPYRTLEVNSFRQSNGLYYTDELSLFGPGWRTRINFDKSAEVGPYDAAKPPAIIRKL